MLFHLDLTCQMNPAAYLLNGIFFYPLSTGTAHKGNKSIQTCLIILAKKVSGCVGARIFQEEGQ